MTERDERRATVERLLANFETTQGPRWKAFVIIFERKYSRDPPSA